MNSKWLSIAKYILLMGVAFGLLAFAFRGVSVRAIFVEMSHAKSGWLLLSILLSLISFVSRAIRWKLLIEPLGYSPSLKKTTYALMVGYFTNLALPRLGEVTRCGSLSKAESIPFSSLLGTVIVERIIDVLSLFLCMLLAAILEYERLGHFLNDNILQPLGDKFGQLMSSPLFVMIAGVLIVALIIFIVLLLKKSKWQGGESKLTALIRGLIQGLRSVANLKRPGLFIFHSIFIWFLSFLGMYVCFFALAPTSHLGLTAALFLLVIGGLGMAAPVQGGIGAFHLLVSQGLVLYGLSRQDGLTFATLVHSISLLLVVACGIASLILLFADNKKRTLLTDKQ
jgi:uncharacterized protein (TIRG00374 family)